MQRVVIIISLLLCLLSSATVSYAETHQKNKHSSELDSLSYLTLNHILSGNFAQAEPLVFKLTKQFPDYPLGHLLKAEVLQARGMQSSLLANVNNFSPQIIELLLEAKTRTHHNPAGDKPSQQALVPELLIQAGSHVDNILIADVEQSVFYLYDTRFDTPKLIKKHYIASGRGGFGKQSEGDLKTPLGVYHITGYRSGASLPALYGSGALMLDYPNALDNALGRSGSGIWLHGIPSHSRSRSPRSSEGCVTMANDHLLDLKNRLDPKRTLVVLSNKIRWIDANQQNDNIERFSELFNQYQDALLNQRHADLKSIYELNAWRDKRAAIEASGFRQVTSNTKAKFASNGINLKALAQVSTSDIAILKNPELDRQSNNQFLVMSVNLGHLQPGRLTLYWHQNSQGLWQISHEHLQLNGI